jgi:HlyD family secretion protein
MAGVAGLIAAGFFWAMRAKPVAVDIDTVTRAPLVVTVDEEGKTAIKNVYAVSAPIAGKVLRTPVKTGDIVEKGTSIVAVIQPPPPSLIDVRSKAELESASQAAAAALSLAEAELAQSNADLHFAQADLTRARELSIRAVVAERTLQKAEIEVETKTAAVARANANVALRKRELESAQVRMLTPDQSFVERLAETACCFEVKSPESGRVLKVIAESEAIVQSGAPLLEIGNPQDLEVSVELLSSDAVRVERGAKAMIEGWGGPALPAHVTKVYPSGFTKVSALGIEEQRVKVLLDFEGAKEDRARLGHDFRVFVRIHVYENKQAVRVPLAALFRRSGEWAVYIIEDGIARERRIEVGERNPSYAEIVSGLNEGDRIILHPNDKVSDGVKIAARAAAPG